NAEALRETLSKHPQIEGFLGDCILSDLSGRMEQGQLDLQRISVLEAELAAQAAWKKNTEEYTWLLNQLVTAKKPQTPLVLYVAAVAIADSSPTETVGLLIKASRLQQAQESDNLAIEAVEVARQAAQLAYTLFTQTRQNCPLVLDAFDNYCLIAGEDVDEQLEYLHAVVLNNCGNTHRGEKLLKEIAARPAGRWRNRARLDLIKLATRQKHDATEQQHAILLDQLGSLIADSTGNENERHVRIEAILLYCGLLLESEDQSSAQKVLDTVAVADETQDPNLAILKSIALRRLGRLTESARCLVRAIDASRCDHVSEAMELLSEVVDEIDGFQSTDLSFMDDCERLARLSYGCLEGQARQKAAFFLLEISTYSAKMPEEGLSALQKLLGPMAAEGLSDNVNFIRCRARLLTELGKFEEAAEVWTKIAEIRKDDPAPPRQRSWKWWRARYYELLCRSKSPQTDKESLLHTIEVLENSFTTIPPPWAEKIRSLRQIEETAEFAPNN
ncbi:MAG: hypothetical protein ACYS4W_13910, partial [Planctomycetota bacterium]